MKFSMAIALFFISIEATQYLTPPKADPALIRRSSRADSRNNFIPDPMPIRRHAERKKRRKNQTRKKSEDGIIYLTPDERQYSRVGMEEVDLRDPSKNIKQQQARTSCLSWLKSLFHINIRDLSD